MKAHILDFRLIVNNKLFMHAGDEQVIIHQSNIILRRSSCLGDAPCEWDLEFMFLQGDRIFFF